jgi:uncharacterized Zn-finger protein
MILIWAKIAFWELRAAVDYRAAIGIIRGVPRSTKKPLRGPCGEGPRGKLSMTDSDDNAIVYVDSRKVSCDGGSGAAGHPNVYLNIQHGEDRVVCPYCSRTFVLQGDPTQVPGH